MRSRALLDAALALSSEREPDEVLGLVLENARRVIGCRYAALGIYGDDGLITTFVHRGVDEATAARIGQLPRGRGLLGEVIVAEGPIRLDDLSVDPRSVGFPPHHPRMRTFLGVPVATRRRRYGNLYLTEKNGGRPFDDTDEKVAVTLAAFAAAAIETALLVSHERERAAAESELAAARERQRLQQEMIAAIIHAQEAERARVARDLHDTIGQALTSVLLGLHLVESSLQEADVDQARERTQEVRDLTADALRQVRALAFELRPTVLDDVGLLPALRRLAADTSERCGIHVTIASDGLGEDIRLDARVETVLYRVVQEALTNVVRHASATTVRISVIRTTAKIRAVVEDDGVGFDPAAAASSLGLRGMAERARLVGGTVTFDSAPGQGTTVTLEVPCA